MNYMKIGVIIFLVMFSKKIIAQNNAVMQHKVSEFNLVFEYPDDWFVTKDSLTGKSINNIHFYTVVMYSPEYVANGKDEFSNDFVTVSLEMKKLHEENKELRKEVNETLDLIIKTRETLGLPPMKYTLKKVQFLNKPAYSLSYPTNYGSSYELFTIINNYKYSLNFRGGRDQLMKYFDVYNGVQKSLKMTNLE